MMVQSGSRKWMYAIVLLFAYFGNASAPARMIGFDDSPLGTFPRGWTVQMTHTGASPDWQICRDDSAPSSPNVLAQLSADRTAGRFPLAILEDVSLENGRLSVGFKPVSGVIDQAAGIVWRYRDPENYYIARANALENNVVLYKVQNGVRTSIPPKGLPSRSYGVNHVIAKQKWSTLRVDIQDARFTVYLDNERLFEVEDQTFPAPGKVGLWTKADSVIYFDNFSISTSSGDAQRARMRASRQGRNSLTLRAARLISRPFCARSSKVKP